MIDGKMIPSVGEALTQAMVIDQPSISRDLFGRQNYGWHSDRQLTLNIILPSIILPILF